MSLRIPPLLETYLALPPEASLILLTSVLGASTNWLVLRHLYSYLRGSGSARENGADVGVVLVSFMRDGAFWREGASRLGLDLDAMAREGRFVLVDGLTGLFTGESGTSTKDRVLRSSKLGDMRIELEAALGTLRSETKILVVDQLDVVLAASENLTSSSLSTMLLSLREHCYSTLLTLSADAPLLHSQGTTLEKEHAALVLDQAHASGRIMALRMLDTGTAKDVSGVMRITGRLTEGEEEKELLYYVAGDGSVKVFERGA